MLRPEEIKELIDDDKASTRKTRAAVGQRYYEGQHDILQYRMFYFNADGKLVEDTTRSNMRIPHPFFTELADQLAPYMLSFEKNPIRAKLGADNAADALQEQLDSYFGDDFWSEIGDLITGAYVKGFEYLYGYKDENDRLAFQCADSLGVVEVREKDSSDGRAYVIYWYVEHVGKSDVTRIQVHGPDMIEYYVMDKKGGRVYLDEGQPLNPRPNVVYRDQRGQLYGKGLGFIPFWRLDNCKQQASGLEPIKGIIDDYDLMKCGLSNNLQDFDHPLYVVRGFDGDNLDELMVNLRTKKGIGTPDSSGGVDIQTINIPIEARKANLEEDEKNIYRFGMGFNSSQVGDGNVTNVVIRSRYTLLDLKAEKLEKQLKKLLRKLIPVVLDEINATEGTDYSPEDVEIKFERNVPTNEQENVQNDYTRAQTKQLEVNTVLNAAAQIGDEATLSALCAVLDLDPEEIKAQLDEAAQDAPEAAQATLAQVVTDDEQEAEASPTVPAEE